MNNNWVGVTVSVNCKESKGTYQGQIESVTSTSLIISKVFHNGVPTTDPAVLINVTDIADLKLISSKPEPVNGKSTVIVAKPIAKRVGRSISMSECTSTSKINMSAGPSKPKSLDIENKPHDFNGCKNGTSLKKDKWTKKWRDEACFGDAMDQNVLQDFDFEKNLALFNKEAVWQEINASRKSDVSNQNDQNLPKKYRHNENIIATVPTMYRQIIVPSPDTREYVSDDGLIIPSITLELRRQLFAAAEVRGFSIERHTEMMGRAATEMAIGLLGGGHRLNPNNSHQWPNVAVLCGPHRQGAIALNCARHLANHGVNTIIHTVLPDPSGTLRSEFGLYKLTKSKMTASVAGLPRTADLLIIALSDDSDVPMFYPHIQQWAAQNRAPILAIDPHPSGTPGIVSKYSLLPALPLSHSHDNGKLYLCDVGIPLKIFRDVGIKYKSPFGPKFVIPLHPNDT